MGSFNFFLFENISLENKQKKSWYAFFLVVIFLCFYYFQHILKLLVLVWLDKYKGEWKWMILIQLFCCPISLYNVSNGQVKFYERDPLSL